MSVMFSKIYDHDASILDLIQDDDVVAISDFNMATTSEYLINQLYSRYQRLGHPNNIFSVRRSSSCSWENTWLYCQTVMRRRGSKTFERLLMSFLGFSPGFRSLSLTAGSSAIDGQ